MGGREAKSYLGLQCPNKQVFLSDPGVLGVRSMGPDVTKWVRDIVAELTDVTLAYKDTNSIRTDNVNRAFQGNIAMKVTQPCGQLWNQYI